MDRAAATERRLRMATGLWSCRSAASPRPPHRVPARRRDRRGRARDPAGVHSITCNNFMAGGGDGFMTFVSGTLQVGGPIVLDALIEYVEDHTPVTAALDGRMAN